MRAGCALLLVLLQAGARHASDEPGLFEEDAGGEDAACEASGCADGPGLFAKGAGHDFDNPNLDHTRAAIDFENKGLKDDAVKAFQSATRFNPTWSTFTDLGVCMMRRNRLGEAEEAMLKADSLASTEQAKKHVGDNLDALEQHLAYRRGEEVHHGMSYRRRRGTGPAIEGSTGKASPGKRRPELVHQRPMAPRARKFKRRSTADLDKAFANPKKRRSWVSAPFVLTDGMVGWKMLETWGAVWQQELKELFPKAVADFYPYNMLSKDRQSPYLSRLPVGVKELTVPVKRSRFDPPKPSDNEGGRYMHVQLTPKMWAALEERKLVLADRHPFLSNDRWLDQCMTDELKEEWCLKTHWKIILVGTRGAGMFNHSDSLRTSSWHAHVMGDKWWYVCGRLRNGTHTCFEGVLKPGEILYYPPQWHHETQCLSTPTMTITDTVAHAYNAEGLMGKTYGECTGRPSLRFQFSSKLCDALDECTEYWRKQGEELGIRWSGERLASWRANARPGEVKTKEAISPTSNNYDGKNFIAEEWN